MQHRTLWRRLLALALVLSLVGAACGDDDSDEGKADKGNASEEGSKEKGDGKTLAGMKGTTPLVDLEDDFTARMDEVDPELADYNYGAESYDAVVVIALAATKANSDGIEYAKEINGITREGEKCTEFAACAKLLEAGEDIDYDGYSGPIEMNEWGSPSAASMGVYEYGPDNNYTPVKFIEGQI